MVAVERQQDFLDRFRALEQRVRQLENAAPLQNATISGGAGLTIQDLGRFLIERGGSALINDGQGRVLLYAGGLSETVPGVPQGYGVFLARLDGSYAMRFSDDADDEQVQRWKFYDRNGKRILAEDPQGDGLEWPALPLVFANMDYTTWPGTPSTTFTALAQAVAYRQHRRAFVTVRHTTDESTTSGQLRLMVNGTQVGSTISVGFGIGENLVGAFDVPGVHGDSTTYTIEARTTAGPGKVRAAVVRASAAGFF